MRGWWTGRRGAGPGLALVVLALVVLGLAVGLGALWRGPGPLSGGPQDRGRAVLPEGQGPLRISVLGTSLSADRYDWPMALSEALGACLEREVQVTALARPGATVEWGVTQVAQVRATMPDIVLVEFAINDADLTDGLSLAQARAHLAELVLQLTSPPEAPQVALMTMNPAAGLRGLLRPRLSAHYAGYRALAARDEGVGEAVGLIDVEARWRARPRSARGLDDGLHPDPATARAVIVPAVSGWFGCADPIEGSN